MGHLRRVRATLLGILAVTAFCAQTAAGQVKQRIILLHETMWPGDEGEARVELLEVKVAGLRVVPGRAFEADENWLKNITLRVKIIAPRPALAFDMGGVLYAGPDEEPPPHASVERSILWRWGRMLDPEKEKRPGGARPLKSGQVVELSYANVGELSRQTLGKAGEGTFCKLELGAYLIQYTDGTTSSLLMKSYGGTPPR